MKAFLLEKNENGERLAGKKWKVFFKLEVRAQRGANGARWGRKTKITSLYPYEHVKKAHRKKIGKKKQEKKRERVKKWRTTTTTNIWTESQREWKMRKSLKTVHGNRGGEQKYTAEKDEKNETEEEEKTSHLVEVVLDVMIICRRFSGLQARPCTHVWPEKTNVRKTI